MKAYPAYTLEALAKLTVFQFKFLLYSARQSRQG
jgi:hypothetical protein